MKHSPIGEMGVGTEPNGDAGQLFVTAATVCSHLPTPETVGKGGVGGGGGWGTLNFNLLGKDWHCRFNLWDRNVCVT